MPIGNNNQQNSMSNQINGGSPQTEIVALANDQGLISKNQCDARLK